MRTVTLQQAGPRVWWSLPDPTTDRPVLGAVAGSDATLMVDAGNSPAHARAFLDALRERGLPPVRYLVYTHWHWDHVWGASEVLRQHAPVLIAHEITAARVREQAQMAWNDASLDDRVSRGPEVAFCRDHMRAEMPSRDGLVILPPTVIFRDSLEIDLGGARCLLRHVGGDHAPDSTLIHVPEDEVLFAGDAMYPSLYSQVPHYRRDGFLDLLDRVLGHGAELHLLSHDADPVPREQALAFAGICRRVAAASQDPEVGAPALFEALCSEEIAYPITLELVTDLVNAFRAGAG
jgi:glyoxylase-like metal-dependent hydrolase (beta-lactamase superfamily II)